MEIDFEAIVFVILSAAAIIGALGCVYARRVAHSLLSLMLTFLDALLFISSVTVTLTV
jgi:NADH:ubiquinone oxidoreductase subunit 6 (subunit J)